MEVRTLVGRCISSYFLSSRCGGPKCEQMKEHATALGNARICRALPVLYGTCTTVFHIPVCAAVDTGIGRVRNKRPSRNVQNNADARVAWALEGQPAQVVATVLQIRWAR